MIKANMLVLEKDQPIILFGICLLSNCENPFNWPLFVVSRYYPDFLGREILKAYGTCHIPSINGSHERTLSMFYHISSYSFTSILEILFGEKAELIPKKFWLKVMEEKF